MGTVVSIRLASTAHPDARQLVEEALNWFAVVEAQCSRFLPDSALRLLCRSPGVDVPVDSIFFEVLRLAVKVAEVTNGAFDPTVGATMELRGFNQQWQTGEEVATFNLADPLASWRDIHLNDITRTVCLSRPMLLDLGAIAKGFAVDLAARALHACGDFAIDAGGDLFLSGMNGEGEPWRVGVRHPRDAGRLLTTLSVSNAAVCTSGDYEKRSRLDNSQHHLLDPHTRQSTDHAASVTVIAEQAAIADALATAGMVLDPTEAIALFESQAVEALIVMPDLTVFETSGMYAYLSDVHDVS